MFNGKYTYRFGLLLWSVFSSIDLVKAQSADSVIVEKDFLFQSQPWLSSGHVLGISYLPVSSYSVVRGSATPRRGDFINFFEADRSISLGTDVTSYRRLTPKTTLSGSIAYQNFLGQNMGGSAFLTPTLNPFDINEYADTTTGAKRLEHYKVQGGVSSELTPKMKIGGQVKYETGNYTKLKDMRHTNKLLQFDMDLAASWQLQEQLQLGLGYKYHRRIESLGFRIYGNTDRQYQSLINFGSFMGMIELYDSDSGYMAETNPLFDQSHGVSLTLSTKLFENLNWFSEITYGRRAGYFGKEGTTQIKHTEHEGDRFTYQGNLTFRQPSRLHHLQLVLVRQQLDNFQNVYRRETELGGARRIVYYGQNKVFDRNEFSTVIDYTLHTNAQDWTPRWTYRLRGEFTNRRQSTTIYPYYRKQDLGYYRLGGTVTRNLRYDPHIFQVSIGLTWGAGHGDPFQDGTYTPPSSNQSAPATKNNLLYLEYEYLTASRVTGDLGVTYSRVLKQNKSAFAKLSIGGTKAFEIQYIGSKNIIPQLELGYRF